MITAININKKKAILKIAFLLVEVSGFVYIFTLIKNQCFVMSCHHRKTAHRTVSILFYQSCLNKNMGTTYVVPIFLVGVSGFEPEASWTRTKRDTKLRHTPLTSRIIKK